MLDAFVIEEIRRRERERGRDERTGVHIPAPEPITPSEEEKPPEAPPGSGGVIIIDYGQGDG
ncbi:MAG: hypothetical protein WCS72_03560 [Deltaproteobacteria bacterium]